MRWLDGWHHRLNGHEFVQAPGDGEGQASLACCSPWGRKESDWTTTYLLNEGSSTAFFLNVTWLQLIILAICLSLTKNPYTAVRGFICDQISLVGCQRTLKPPPRVLFRDSDSWAPDSDTYSADMGGLSNTHVSESCLGLISVTFTLRSTAPGGSISVTISGYCYSEDS